MIKTLWIEDDDEHYNLYSKHVSIYCTIDRAINYEEAIEKANKDNYELIIVDILIPSGKQISDLQMIEKIHNDL